MRKTAKKQLKKLWNFGELNTASGILPSLTFGKFFDVLEQPNYMPRPDNKQIFQLKQWKDNQDFF
jgi:hypothetical protein